jgi:hypothetical protein
MERLEMARFHLALRLTRPFYRIPIVGQVLGVFWYAVIAEPTGILDMLSFHFMNDYIFQGRNKPTLWHTWYSITHENDAPYSGIYTQDPPPASLKEAEALEAKYQARSSIDPDWADGGIELHV